jgi:hypothetical protein
MTGSQAIRHIAAATASRCALERAGTPDTSYVRASQPAIRAQLIVPNAACSSGRHGLKNMYRYTLEA